VSRGDARANGDGSVADRATYGEQTFRFTAVTRAESSTMLWSHDEM